MSEILMSRKFFYLMLTGREKNVLSTSIFSRISCKISGVESSYRLSEEYKNKEHRCFSCMGYLVAKNCQFQGKSGILPVRLPLFFCRCFVVSICFVASAIAICQQRSPLLPCGNTKAVLPTA